MKQQANFLSDERGFSTTIDVLLFLVLISIAAVILLPTITGNVQVRSVLDSKSQSQSSRILTTILNGNVDEFGYTVAGDQLDFIAGPVNDSSLYIAGKKLIAGRELKHRTFTDVAAEDAAAQWMLYFNGTGIRLNFLMTNYTNSLDAAMKEYLDRHLGDMYNYNFTVVWHPIVNVPVGSEVSIGEPAPGNAYVETADITMPYRVDFSRYRVESIVDENFNTSSGNISSTFFHLKNDSSNRTQIEDEITQEIFDSINATIDEAAMDLVDETVGPVLDEVQETASGHFDSLVPNGSEEMISMINGTFKNIMESQGVIVNESVSETFKLNIQQVGKQETRRISDGEIRTLVTELSDMYVNDVMTIDEVRECIITEVFSRISIDRAKVTLAIWERRG